MASTIAVQPAPPAAAGLMSSAPANSSSNGDSNDSSTGTTTTDSIQEQIRQLNDARKLVLANVSVYPTIVQGILPIISPTSLPPLRRWGADFLAEAFAAPALPLRDKESLSLLVLGSIKGMLENANEDALVLRSIIQAAASIYPLVLRWIINNSYDGDTWERISAIKSRILRLWESPVTSVQICCIKFAQRVVLVQTHAAHTELKRGGLDISLSMIPTNHPLLDARRLEAEATGLLDRMLGVLQDNSSDALIVDATLNTLSVLVRTRPSTVQRTLNAALSFNPLKLAEGQMTPRMRVMVKSMEKTTRMFLIHLSKRDPNNPFNLRIQQHVERLIRSRAELFDDIGRKRPMMDHNSAMYGNAKRQRLATGDAAVSPHQLEIPSLGPGPKSLADIFALTANQQLRTFNVSDVPLDLAAKISVSTLARVDLQLFERALDGIRSRLAGLDADTAQLPLNPDTAPLDVEDDDDYYEPDFSGAEDAEQILNKLDNEAPDQQDVARLEDAASLALGAFKLPGAPRLTPEQATKVGQATVTRVFDMVRHTGEDNAAGPSSVVARDTKVGINRVAASTFDRDAWITILTRLATRSTSGLDGVEREEENDEGGKKSEDSEDKKEIAKTGQSNGTATGKPALTDKIRDLLFRYVLEDFRKRIDVAVAWLCEEWYNDRLSKQYRKAAGDELPHYDAWVVKVLDGFLPYLHAQDNKVLTRFLSEVPALNRGLLQRVKGLCRDPSMVPVALTSLLYQLIMRPPARTLTLDMMEEIWVEFEDARPMASKYLDKWRPGFVQAHSGNAADGSNAAADSAETAA